MAAMNLGWDDLNFENWGPKAKAKLKKKGLWDVVENGVPPDPSKIPELAATIQAEELSQWRDLVVKDMKALKILQSSLPDSAFRKTLLAVSAKDVWDLLEKGNNEQTKIRIQQFEELSMDEAEPIKIYVERVLDIVKRLRISGHPKSDHLIIKKLLTSLSRSYDVLLPLLDEIMDLPFMSLENLLVVFDMLGSITEKTMPSMLKAFLDRHKLCGICNEKNHNEEDCDSIPCSGDVIEAMEARPKKGKCYRCGERGHYASDCNESDQRRLRPDYLMLAAGDSTFDETMWMIYKGSTNHMTPYLKFFTTLDRTHKGLVGLIDGSNIMVKGKGDVMIKTKEGKKKMIMNVLFVPELDRNVLSVDQMASRGYAKIVKGDKCIIQKLRTGIVFGETSWDDDIGFALRLKVIQGNLAS